MNKLKRMAHIGFFIVVPIILIGVIFISLNGKGNKPDVEQPDLNNFSIELLSEDQILYVSNQYKASKTHEEGKYNRDYYLFSSKEITGIITLSKTLAKDCNLELAINSKIDSGTVRLVLICDEQILEIVDPTSDMKFTYKVVGEHTYYVKALCGTAKMEIVINKSCS